jgi:vacuolar-type H+-ATPase subunit I/STV1
MAANKQASVATVIATVHDAPAGFVIGLVLVAAALALILCHNVWSGGVLPVVVTLIGWLSLIKGALFLILPPPAAVGVVIWGSVYEQYFYADMALGIGLGIYLTIAGWRARARA